MREDKLQDMFQGYGIQVVPRQGEQPLDTACLSFSYLGQTVVREYKPASWESVRGFAMRVIVEYRAWRVEIQEQ